MPMRVFAIAAVAVLGLGLGGQVKAANLSGAPLHSGRSYFGSSYDGPYYIMPRGDSAYIECGKPRMPYRDDAYGPAPNSAFFGPVGYRCFRGTYAVDPFIAPRCRVAFIQTSYGWKRETRCY